MGRACPPLIKGGRWRLYTSWLQRLWGQRTDTSVATGGEVSLREYKASWTTKDVTCRLASSLGSRKQRLVKARIGKASSIGGQHASGNQPASARGRQVGGTRPKGSTAARQRCRQVLRAGVAAGNPRGGNHWADGTADNPNQGSSRTAMNGERLHLLRQGNRPDIAVRTLLSQKMLRQVSRGRKQENKRRERP